MVFSFQNKILLTIVDSALVLFVFYPSMVWYWRGIWDLWGVYINPQKYPSPRWDIIGIVSVCFAGYFIGPKLQKVLETKNKILGIILTRCHLYVYAAFYMGYWRGLWETLDVYVPKTMTYSIVNGLVAYLPLVLLRCSRTCIIPPMKVALDTNPNALTPATRFGTKPYTENYFLDCFLSHFVVNGCVIASWRAMWNINYLFIFPDDEYFADHFSLGIGYLLCTILYAVDKPLALLSAKCARAGFWWRLIFEDISLTVVFWMMALLWRGAWNCTVRYTYEDPEKGGWLCFIIGSIGLLAVQNMSYGGGMGCVIDGECADTDVFFQSKFLRHFLASKTSSYKPGEEKNIDCKLSTEKMNGNEITLKSSKEVAVVF